MKKKVLSAVLALTLVFGSAAALPKGVVTDTTGITASAATLGDYEYELLENGTVKITQYKKSTENVIIPSTLDGKAVTCIGEHAFTGNESLKSITIPSSVTSIDKGAFWDCSSLSSVSIPNSVTSIGNTAFYKCTSLTGVTIPNSVTSIGSNAFSGCANLVNITIPSSVTSIGIDTFSGTKWLKNQQNKNPIVVVNGILIDGRACIGKVTIPNSVTSIVGWAFANGSYITSITIPSSVKTIGDYAFYWQKKLSSVTIADSVTSIGQNAFKDTQWLENEQKKNPLVVVNGILINGTTCSGKVTIPSSVKSISAGAFENCSSLTGITVPTSVASIGDYAFNNCNQLKAVSYEGSNEDWDKIAIGDYNDPLKNVKFKINRLAGSNRYGTAAEISKASFDKADTVIIANGMDYADALAGVPLAKKLNAPILLTGKDSLPNETLNEIKRLGAKQVLILGGEGAVSYNVDDTLVKNGIKNPSRLAGKNRFGTATAIAQYLTNGPTEVFFVYANDFADALSVSSVAAIKGAPIIYLSTDGDLNADTAAYLAKIKGKVKNAYVIGGTGVISDDMMKKAGNALGVTPTRVAGKNRYETCTAVNTQFKSLLPSDGVCVAKGLDFPDALAGGVYAAKNGLPLFLADGSALKDCQKSYLKEKNPARITVFGGQGAVSDALIGIIAGASIKA